MARNYRSEYNKYHSSHDMSSTDFELRMRFYTSNVTVEKWLWSDWVETGDNRGFAVRVNGGNLQVFYSQTGTNVIENPFDVAISASDIHDIRIRLIGTTIYLQIDDGAEVSNTLPTQLRQTSATKQIGAKNGEEDYFDGYIYDVKVWTGGDSDTGTLVYDYQLADDWSVTTVAEGDGATTTAINISNSDVDFFYFNTTTVPWRLENAAATTTLDFGYTVGWALIWLIGQSNMIGRATIVGGIDDDYTLIDGTQQFGYNAQAIIAATNPLDHVNEQAGDMGLWLQFVKDFALTNKYDQPILLVPCAEGGTGFATNDWNPGDTLNTNAKNSLTAALATETENTLAAAFWLQGETDADNQNNTYQADITAMYNDFVTTITQFTVETPFIACTILGSTQPTYVPIINAALSSFINTLTSGALVDATDLVLFDAFHYDAPSLRTIGSRFATELDTVVSVFPTLTVPLPLGNAAGITAAASNVIVSINAIPDLTQIATNTVSWDAGATPSWQQEGLSRGTTYNVTFRDNATGNTGSIDITAV